MSLLLQALQKAERARLNSEGEVEPEASRLSLTPQPGTAGEDSLSLSPLTDLNDAAPPEPGAARDNTASTAASAAAPLPEPPQAGAAKSQTWDDPHAPRAAAESAAGTAAPARATVRLAVLGGIVLLIVAGFGYRYWQALSGPGAGSNLPMVPMPSPNASGAVTIIVPVPAPAPAVPDTRPDPAREDSFAPQPGPVAAERAPYPAASRAPAAPVLPATPNAPQSFQSGMPAAPPQAGMPPPQAGMPPTETPPAMASFDAIKVTRDHTGPRVNPALQRGYAALNAGDAGDARRQYDAVLGQEPNNRDALLGLAAIALRDGEGQRAAALYQRLLELDPDDGEAQAGLTGMRRGDPAGSELELKAILRRTPDSGPALFALGNLYARQGRWPEAQQAYFRASGAAPDNPDYAFNLAVGLDRLNQGKLALEYYARALILAQDKPAGFAADAVRRRMDELGAGQPSLSPQ
jgi:tetratricopeptide (TPR) repeat protein